LNLDKSIDKLSERLDDLYPDEDGPGKGVTHWKGKPIIPAKEWKKISGHNRLEFTTSGLKAFPDDLVPAVLVLFGGYDEYAEDIYPYHDGDPRPGTDEWKQSLDLPDENKLSDAELKLWRTRLEERRAKAKKEDPLEIWIQEYKELLAFKKIPLPVYEDSHIF
jgi:hypothetical protein